MGRDVKNMENKKAGDFLREKADLFDLKGKEYGHSYLQFGKIMKEIFPGGCTVFTEDDWNKFGAFFMSVHKLIRIANTNFNSMDSIEDLQVYGAILEEICRGIISRTGGE
jgi:hypothetical protein